MIKPLFLLLAWLAGGMLAALAFFLVFAPFIVSVIANIGRRPVVRQAAEAKRGDLGAPIAM
jgi:hypothetical protein